MSGSDLTAGTWDITRTRGDIMVPDEFVLELNGSPWVVESVKLSLGKSRCRYVLQVLHVVPVLAAG